MDFDRVICRSLHNEHQQTAAMMRELESLLAHSRSAPDLAKAGTRKLFERIVAVVQGELRVHFAFEEVELFTRLADEGETEIGEHLKADHDVIMPLGERMVELAAAALTDGMSDATWQAFRATAAEVVERLLAHIEKEEMGLLPLLEDHLDADADRELVAKYEDMRV